MLDNPNKSITDNVRELCNSTIEIMDNMDARREQIEEAMQRGLVTHSFDDVCDMVLKQNLNARFYRQNSFVLTSVHEYPLAKHYHIFLGGGNLEVLLGAIPGLIEEAKALECTRMTVNGRPGWAKALKETGAKHAYTMLAMEL